jgi:magnesium chelatase family protein
MASWPIATPPGRQSSTIRQRLPVGTRSATAPGVLALADADATICGKALQVSSALSSALVGLEAWPIRVEVSCTRGPAFFQMVGLPEATVREARVRVKSALARLGVLVDQYAITVNLAPADLRKSGAALDVALAVGVLEAVEKLPPAAADATLLLGELSLDGRLQPIRGVLPQLRGAHAHGTRSAIVPASNGAEAGLVTGMDVRVARTLEEVWAQLAGRVQLPRAPRLEFVPDAHAGTSLDFSDVRGQSSVRRALEIAAAGNHNVLLIGPPGGGKTMLARLLPTIFPALSFEEALETTAIFSVAGLVDPEQGIVTVRPFRAPHHCISDAGLVGGGRVPTPGEVSLAHNGVLFLDELAEFRRSALEALRQPLEDGTVCIARVSGRAWFPARPLFVGAVNPCPCGYYGHPRRACRCSRAARSSYQARLSGPLLDRLDVHVSVPPVEVTALTRAAPAESSAAVRQRVIAARDRQRARFQRGETSNAFLTGRDLSQVAALDASGQRLLESAVAQLGLSARAFTKILRVARSIADLEGEAQVRSPHVAEAIQGRLLDREALP